MEKIIGIGLMSGTSLDGLDVVVLEIEQRKSRMDFKVIGAMTEEYTPGLRNELFNLCTPSVATADKISSMNMYLGKFFGETVNKILRKCGLTDRDVHFISSHGQTIYHLPFQGESVFDVPGTLQIGDISALSEETGIAVVGDFRTADMAAGGQGAPLVSFVDWMLFHSPEKSRAIQNIGGIGNVTYLNKMAEKGELLSFDTGPGNIVIDEVVIRGTGGAMQFDKNGVIASKGIVNEDLLKHLMSHEYFSLQPPKTTGRELFGKQFVNELLKKAGHLSLEDLVATVTEWTALSIVTSYKEFIINKGMDIDEVIIGGGGSYNCYLLERLKFHLSDIDILTHEDFGIHSNYKEAIAFAILGYRCIRGEYNQIPSATGAQHEVIMGKTAYTSPAALERLEMVRS